MRQKIISSLRGSEATAAIQELKAKSILDCFVVTLLAMTLLLSLLANTAHAQRSDSIAAVVNGDIITYTDVYDRMDLIIKSSRMPNTNEFKEQLLPQVLTGLITEQIQLQEAERLSLSVTDEELEKGFEELAKQNNLEAAQFANALKQQNVKMNTLYNQIESQLAWGKVIQTQIRPRVALTQTDIDSEIERLKTKEGETEYLISEIYLPSDDESLPKGADDIARQLSANPDQFPLAARQLSKSATAAQGGTIGWVTLDQLDGNLATALQDMAPGDVSPPITTQDGQTIILLRDKRTISLSRAENLASNLRIKAAIFNLPNNQAERNRVTDNAQKFAEDVKGCLDIVKQIAANDNVSLREYNDTAENIPSNIITAVADTNIGDVGTIIDTDKTIIVPMLCGRSDGQSGNSAIEREVENRIGTERLDVLQRRYLRDLVTEAYIERRI
jgi:peptidyl-prolyl cis-trans isomerase SurA